MNAKKEILLGVTGGVSAYKSADLLRRLQEAGFAVTVLPTRSSLNFVGTSLWAALSGREVHTDLWSNVHEVPHIALAKKSDLIVVAPATADFLARLSHGEASDLLTSTILASTAPKVLVPAMHTEMWSAPSTITNVEILKSRGFNIIQPESGRMTGEDVGEGRYPATAKIVESVKEILQTKSDLAGKRFLITAGGTREAIDPVRFIGNHSSGKQGIALAEAANARGAEVHLILANRKDYSHTQIHVEHVVTANEMLLASERIFSQCDVLVMAAAVADARPRVSADFKLEKTDFTTIELEPTVDILATLSRSKGHQILFGFAAQTDDHVVKAHEKLKRKDLDFIYVNDVSSGKIFGSDETHGSIITKDGRTLDIASISKSGLATQCLDLILARLR